jgi:xylose dehydrogenase (NAD/NADP)
MRTLAAPLRWGILGTGTVARLAMLPALSRIPSASVRAIASASLDRAQALAADFAVPRAYGSYQQLLDAPDVDCVYVALPNAQHLEWVLRAAAAGKHVLCEKPLGCTALEVEQMERACADAGVRLMEALMYRFHPRTPRLLALLADGTIGTAVSVAATFTFPLAAPSNYRWRAEQGGGALLDVGGYCVSAARMAFVADPVAVQAVATYGDGGADESTSALLEFSGGRTAHVTCSFRAAERQHLTVIGTCGVLDVPLAFTAWHRDPAPLVLWREHAPETLPGEPADPYERMAAAFSDALLRGKPVPYPTADSRATSRVLDAIARAARTGERQRIG